MNKDRCFVCIDGNTNMYSFYRENTCIARVQSEDMTPEWIEEYRKNNFKLLLLDIENPPEAA